MLFLTQRSSDFYFEINSAAIVASWYLASHCFASEAANLQLPDLQWFVMLDAYIADMLIKVRLAGVNQLVVNTILWIFP